MHPSNTATIAGDNLDVSRHFRSLITADPPRPFFSPNDVEGWEKQVGLDLQLLPEANFLEAGTAYCAPSKQ